MRNFWAIYRKAVNCTSDAVAISCTANTPPYKPAYNQIVSRDIAIRGHILALPLDMLDARW